MTILPTTFTKNGFNHRQLTRDGRIALFERSAIKRPGFPCLAPPHYEVVVITAHNGFTFPGADKPTPPGEVYPCATVWGSKGWTFTDKRDAQKKYVDLWEGEL